MDIETILGLVGAGVSFAGIATGFILNVRKSKRELQLIQDRENAEKEARKKAEKEAFYLTTSANLVASAERLNITGPQKKEYVMTWLENEAISAGIEVDRPLMSVTIERSILLLNDHRHTDQPVAELLQEELDNSVKKEQARIKAESIAASKRMNALHNSNLSNANDGINITEKALDDVTKILNKKK